MIIILFAALVVAGLLLPKLTQPTYRGAIYNLGDHRDKTWSDLDAIRKTGALFIILSECLDRHALLVDYADKHGLVIVASDRKKGGWETVIMYDRRLPVSRSWVHRAVAAYRRHDSGAGGKHGIPAKCIPHIRIGRWRNRIHVFGFHGMPSPYLKARRPFFLRALHRLVLLMKRRIGAKLAGGDFNSPPRHPRMDEMREAGFEQQLHENTMRRWQPDHLWSKGLVVEVVELLHLSSDHVAVIFDMSREAA